MSDDAARAGVYRVLSHIYTREFALEDIPKVRTIVEFLPEPFRSSILREIASMKDEDLYLALRVDFTKTFLLYVHPYESVFLDETGLLCTDLSVEVKKFYLSYGYEPDLASARARCFDHIGIELAFMAELVEKREHRAQREFLEKHLARWAPLFAVTVADVASTEFYRQIALFTAHFIFDEYNTLASTPLD